MIKNAMNAAAFLVGIGIAFVGDSHSPNNLSSRFASVDTMITTSISKPHGPVRRPMTLGIDRDVFGL
jgi:hypothetical protein